MKPVPSIEMDDDPLRHRGRTLFWVWIVVGCGLSLFIGFIAYGLSSFCICDAPRSPKPMEGVSAGVITFGVWSVLCALAYPLRRYRLAVWGPVFVAVLIFGFLILFLVSFA